MSKKSLSILELGAVILLDVLLTVPPAGAAYVDSTMVLDPFVGNPGQT